MFNLTTQERAALFLLAVAVLIGSGASYAIKKYPQLADTVNFIDSHRSYAKLDINTADKDELVRVPYIGEYTAEKIVAYRQQEGSFRSLEELKAIEGIREKNFAHFAPYLKVSK